MSKVLNKKVIGLFCSLSIMICTAFLVSSINVSNTEARGICGHVSLPGAVKYISSQALNDKGQVVGYCGDLNSLKKAFIWDWWENEGRYLYAPANSNSMAEDINNSGVASGKINDRPVVWYSSGGCRYLNAPNGVGIAEAINDNNNIAGYINDRAYYWSSSYSSGTYLPTPSNTYSSYAYSINNNKWIVGYRHYRVGPSIDNTTACLWKGPTSAPIGLGILPGGSYSRAFSINNKNQVVGVSDSYNGEQAFIWENGTMKDLGLVGYQTSRATSINDDGVVTGYYYKDGRAGMFTWQNGKFTDLASYAPLGIDINKYGIIITNRNEIYCP